MKRPIERLNVALSGLVFMSGLAIAFSTLWRGVWFDEFVTHVQTARGMSATEFLSTMSTEQHPLLYYGIVYVAQRAGITGFITLRSLNAIGVLLVVAALWRGAHRRALTTTQICIAVALYASSPIFLGYFAELRGYFLVFSAGIAVSIGWLILMARGEGRETNRGDLMFYGIGLAIFANLHYLATVMGALLTLAIVLDRASRRAWSDSFVIALIAVLASAPAIALGLVQWETTFEPGRGAWIRTSRLGGLFTAIGVVGSAAAKNDVALGVGITATLMLAERWRRWKDARDIVILGAATTALFALMLIGNAFRPIVVDRYLFAGAGSILVLVALLCTRPGMPVLSTAAICGCALLVQVHGVRENHYVREGWRTSARYVAQQVEQCPTTTVFAAPGEGSSRTEWRKNFRAFGQDYYAREFNFPLRITYPGETVAAPGTEGGCPTLIWAEHQPTLRDLPVDRLLKGLGIGVTGHAEARYVGSGVVITVR